MSNIKYNLWLEKAMLLKDELAAMTDDRIEDAFRCDLSFGTGGLRGVIGAGTNRMNVYTVGKASQGLADYVCANFPGNKTVAIAYDSRIKSDEFARVAAGVFAANGIRVRIFPKLTPTPMLSFAVRYYGCAAGVVITASHNPSKYNGYKVYGPDGCQITNAAADAILAEISKLDVFEDVHFSDYEEECGKGNIEYISADCNKAFYSAVKAQSVLYGDDVDRDACIVYTPLYGTGLEPVTSVLSQSGFVGVQTVKEQSTPNGNFPTCPYPNPEIEEAMHLGLEEAKRLNADLLLATDPDSDRVGIAVRDGDEMKLLTGNETGMLLFDFICSQRKKHGKMPENPIAVKTVVTTDTAEKIAAEYGVKVINVLTGFKYIGEQIGMLEEKGEDLRYIFGFEESYGYLTGSYVRDKDAVGAALMICEMFAYYKARGIRLIDKLDELYRKYGYRINGLKSFEFEGQSGFERMNEIMDGLRTAKGSICGAKIESILDYSLGIGDLPKSNVLKLTLEDGSTLILRPSGTEPKLKLYTSALGQSREEAKSKETAFIDYFTVIIK